MKKIAFVLLVLLLVSAAAAFAQLPYDSSVAVPIMRANRAAFGQLNGAASEGDFLKASGALATMAAGSLQLRAYTAPEGDQAEWERIHTELIEAALQGILACSEEDAEGLAAAMGQMGSFSQQGHSQFR